MDRNNKDLSRNDQKVSKSNSKRVCIYEFDHRCLLRNSQSRNEAARVITYLALITHVSVPSAVQPRLEH